ncbi:MAG: N-acetylmuramoyl-L-alanine amidase-like domain-containing protein [Thermodesulfovibrionales bacterium]
MNRYHNVPGQWSRAEIERLLAAAAGLGSPGPRIEFISRKFLGVPYLASTLTGRDDGDEVLTINLRGMDCFTFLDYVEAMRHSVSLISFRDNLRQTRYRSGTVSFRTRNHFFTDWIEFNADRIEDVTAQVGGAAALSISRTLNRKQDGTLFLDGIGPFERLLRYVPAGPPADGVMGLLQTGDYAGVFSDDPGLDVSHVGIIVRDGGSLVLRHASQREGRVMDEDLAGYLSGKPGLLILRPR